MAILRLYSLCGLISICSSFSDVVSNQFFKGEIHKIERFIGSQEFGVGGLLPISTSQAPHKFTEPPPTPVPTRAPVNNDMQEEARSFAGTPTPINAVPQTRQTHRINVQFAREYHVNPNDQTPCAPPPKNCRPFPNIGATTGYSTIRRKVPNLGQPRPAPEWSGYSTKRFASGEMGNSAVRPTPLGQQLTDNLQLPETVKPVASVFQQQNFRQMSFQNQGFGQTTTSDGPSQSTFVLPPHQFIAPGRIQNLVPLHASSQPTRHPMRFQQTPHNTFSGFSLTGSFATSQRPPLSQHVTSHFDPKSKVTTVGISRSPINPWSLQAQGLTQTNQPGRRRKPFMTDRFDQSNGLQQKTEKMEQNFQHQFAANHHSHQILDEDRPLTGKEALEQFETVSSNFQTGPNKHSLKNQPTFTTRELQASFPSNEKYEKQHFQVQNSPLPSYSGNAGPNFGYPLVNAQQSPQGYAHPSLEFKGNINFASTYESVHPPSSRTNPNQFSGRNNQQEVLGNSLIEFPSNLVSNRPQENLTPTFAAAGSSSPQSVSKSYLPISSKGQQSFEDDHGIDQLVSYPPIDSLPLVPPIDPTDLSFRDDAKFKNTIPHTQASVGHSSPPKPTKFIFHESGPPPPELRFGQRFATPQNIGRNPSGQYSQYGAPAGQQAAPNYSGHSGAAGHDPSSISQRQASVGQVSPTKPTKFIFHELGPPPPELRFGQQFATPQNTGGNPSGQYSQYRAPAGQQAATSYSGQSGAAGHDPSSISQRQASVGQVRPTKFIFHESGPPPPELRFGQQFATPQNTGENPSGQYSQYRAPAGQQAATIYSGQSGAAGHDPSGISQRQASVGQDVSPTKPTKFIFHESGPPPPELRFGQQFATSQDIRRNLPEQYSQYRAPAGQQAAPNYIGQSGAGHDLNGIFNGNSNQGQQSNSLRQQSYSGYQSPNSGYQHVTPLPPGAYLPNLARPRPPQIQYQVDHGPGSASGYATDSRFPYNPNPNSGSWNLSSQPNSPGRQTNFQWPNNPNFAPPGRGTATHNNAFNQHQQQGSQFQQGFGAQPRHPNTQQLENNLQQPQDPNFALPIQGTARPNSAFNPAAQGGSQFHTFGGNSNSNNFGLQNRVTAFRPQFRPSQPRPVSNARDCFLKFPNSIIVNVPPIERILPLTKEECLRRCLTSEKDIGVNCESAVYVPKYQSCDLFRQNANEPPAKIIMLFDYHYFQPTPRCAGLPFLETPPTNPFGPEQSVPIRTTKTTDRSDGGGTNTRGTNTQFTTFTPSPRTTNPRTKTTFTEQSDGCPRGTSAVFQRSEGFELIGSDGHTTKGISEAECVAACRKNMAPDGMPYECLSLDYSSNLETCILTSEAASPARAGVLIENPDNIYYEKSCLPDEFAYECNGREIDRQSQKVMIGFGETVESVQTQEECIQLCFKSQKQFGFACLSALYFYEESDLNCLLNSESRMTQPHFVGLEGDNRVEYYGIDSCTDPNKPKQKTTRVPSPSFLSRIDSEPRSRPIASVSRSGKRPISANSSIFPNRWSSRTLKKLPPLGSLRRKHGRKGENRRRRLNIDFSKFMSDSAKNIASAELRMPEFLSSDSPESGGDNAASAESRLPDVQDEIRRNAGERLIEEFANSVIAKTEFPMISVKKVSFKRRQFDVSASVLDSDEMDTLPVQYKPINFKKLNLAPKTPLIRHINSVNKKLINARSSAEYHLEDDRNRRRIKTRIKSKRKRKILPALKKRVNSEERLRSERVVVLGDWLEWGPCDRRINGRRLRYRECDAPKVDMCPFQTEWCNTELTKGKKAGMVVPTNSWFQKTIPLIFVTSPPKITAQIDQIPETAQKLLDQSIKNIFRRDFSKNCRPLKGSCKIGQKLDDFGHRKFCLMRKECDQAGKS